MNTTRLSMLVGCAIASACLMGPVRAGTPAEDQVVAGMTRYGYHEFIVKATLGGRGSSACFLAQLEGVPAADEAVAALREDPQYTKYLNALKSGETAKWIADMRPDARTAILCGRDTARKPAARPEEFQSLAGLFAFLQFRRRIPVRIVFSGEATQSESDKTARRFDAGTLAGCDLVIAPGLAFVDRNDLQVLRAYVARGGNLLILGGPIPDEAYGILGITTVGGAEPSGFVLPAATHPVFTVPGGFTGPFGSFRVSEDKHDALTYKPKLGDGWEVLAHEATDSGKRPCIVLKETTAGSVGYVNSKMVGAFTTEMSQVLANMVVVARGTAGPVLPVGFSSSSSVNAFKSADGLTRYFHMFTLDGESGTTMRVRADPGTYPVSARIILGGGGPVPLKKVTESRKLGPGEMLVVSSGNAVVSLPDVEPHFAVIEIKYEKRERE